ncbi:PorT family protein [Sphingobacterium sp. SGG-5]|uniref:porin family protein n=1 Tax=Sphingobacterium sp. SGG-5 TaxID=2710881 RepID=UPI0013EC28D8|nr:porin family protein [Sphingobacterium sp. SGG-5]NGM61683.1 PorT family protein [Sphingobacterium sp. SGG-5]
MKKKLILLGIVLLLIASVQAQVHYGIKGGLNLGKYAYENNIMKDDVRMKPSFYVTGYADLSVAPRFSIQPGISLQGKGSRMENDTEGNSSSISKHIISIEVPINALYYIPTGTRGAIFVGAGPYVGYAISGKHRAKWSGIDNEGVDNEGADINGSISRDIDFSGDDKEMKRFEAGVNFLIGYKLSNGFLINAGYGLGLTNLSTISLLPDYSNRVLSFGVGFQF